MSAPEVINPVNSSRVFALLFVCLVAIGMGQTVVFAVLPALAREVHLSEIQTGMIVSMSSIVFFIGSRYWGRQSDIKGRRPILLIGLIGYTVGTCLFASVFLLGLSGFIMGLPLFFSLVLARMAQSTVMSATPPSSTAYAADLTDFKNRAAGMGKLGAANNMGAILGPVAGKLVVYGLLVPFYAIAVVTGFCAFLVWKFLPEPTRQITNVDEIPSLSFFDPRYRGFLITSTTMFVAFSAVQQVLGFQLIDTFQLSSAQAIERFTDSMLVMAIMSLFAQFVLVQRLAWSPLTLLRIGVPFLLAGFAVLSNATDTWQFSLGMGLMGLGMGLAGPGFTAGASLSVSSREQGALAGLTTACPALGFFFGPTIGTYLYSIQPQYPYIFTLCILSVLTIYVMFLRIAVDNK